MDILVIRHGESEADILHVHEGRADFSLTERGRKQAAAMAEYVSGKYKVDKIYSSTLKRAKQTAEYLARATEKKIILEEDLMEFNNGLLAGLSYDEANKRYPEVKNLPIDKAVYGMESVLEFRQRADKVLKKILDENLSTQTIAVVSHGGMINQLYRSLLDLPVDAKTFFATYDTGIHVWRVDKNAKRIIHSNLYEHTKNI